jgi:hypothetical protein
MVETSPGSSVCVYTSSDMLAFAWPNLSASTFAGSPLWCQIDALRSRRFFGVKCGILPSLHACVIALRAVSVDLNQAHVALWARILPASGSRIRPSERAIAL